MSSRAVEQEKAKAAAAVEAAARAARTLLQIWLSPSFPIGGYAYSHGLEKAAERGWVSNRATLQEWLTDLIRHGSLGNDLILLACAWRTATTSNWPALKSVAQYAAALQPSAERYLEATQQGASFITQIEAAYPHAPPAWRDATHDAEPTLATALGFVAARHSLPLNATLDAYATAFVGAQTSAAIRLSLIGQTDAQIIIASLLTECSYATERAARATLDDIGSAVWSADLASLQHETQQTRLFRS